MQEARVRSLDSINAWRSSLIVFQGKARRGVGEVGEEVKRTRQWLENEVRPFWEQQIKKRSRRLDQAKQELITARNSTLRATLMTQEQAVRKATAALQEAEEKLRKTKRWCRDFDRVVEPLVKKLEGFHHYLEHDLPKGIVYLQQVLRTLEGYTESAGSTLKEAAPEAGLAELPPSETKPDTP